MSKGRNGEPIQLHIYKGNPSHLTKEEIEQRIAAEKALRFGSADLKMPKLVRINKDAKTKWNELIKLFKDYRVDFISSSDTGILERYCITHAEYVNLQRIRDEVNNKGWDPVKTHHALEELNLEYRINQKADLLTKLEDRLFLNPLAKIRNIPKTQLGEREQTPLEKAGFGGL